MAFERRKMSPRLVIGFVLAAAALMFTFQRTMTFAGVTVEDDEEHSSSVGSYYEAGISRVETSSQDLKAVGGGAAMGGSHKFSILYSPYYLAMFLGSPFLWQARKPIHVFSALETLIYQIMILYICIHWRAVVRIRFITVQIFLDHVSDIVKHNRGRCSDQLRFNHSPEMHGSAGRFPFLSRRAVLPFCQ